MKYIELGYTTKNLPDAIKWHFSGTWNHMFKKIPKYKNNWKKNWSYTRKLLLRSISIPILVKSKNNYIDNHASKINKILKSL